jgi:hypothetical protein
MEQQESMSEEDRKHISKRKKRGEKEREKEKGEKANSKGKGNSEKEKGKEKEGKIKVISEKEKEIVKIYLSLKNLNLSSSASSDSELSKDDEADLEEEAAQYERDRYDPDWPYRANQMKKGVSVNKRTKPKCQQLHLTTLIPQEKRSPLGLLDQVPPLCPEVLKGIGLNFPVFVDGQGQWYH